MKKILLSSIMVVIFGISFLQAQPSRLDSVITKFQNDNRSFEEYIVLGRMVCYDKLRSYENVINESETYLNVSLQFYNSLSPRARLFNELSTIKNIEEYFLFNIKYFKEIDERKEWLDKVNSYEYKRVKLCNSLFNKNKDYKKQYLKLVNDKNNYRVPTNDTNSFSWEEIESYRKDYLEHYFIQIKMDACPKRGSC